MFKRSDTSTVSYGTFWIISFTCIYHNPINARELYDKYKVFFYNPKYEKSNVENIALNIINKNLQKNGYSSTDFKLPDISTYIEEYNDETFYEKCNTLNEVHHKINTLKTNQNNIFNVYLSSKKILDPLKSGFRQYHSRPRL